MMRSWAILLLGATLVSAEREDARITSVLAGPDWGHILKVVKQVAEQVAPKDHSSDSGSDEKSSSSSSSHEKSSSSSSSDTRRRRSEPDSGTSGAAKGDPVDIPAGQVGAFISNVGSKSFSWSSRKDKDVAGKLKQAMGRWSNPYKQSVQAVAKFVNDELLAKSPFGDKDVLVPWAGHGDDQLGDGGYVGYSRRQVCYIAAQHFLGASTNGYNSGLKRLMAMCHSTGHFRQSFAFLLAACAADPTLKDGKQGPLILVAKAGAAPGVGKVRKAAKDVKLEKAGLRVCDYDTDVDTPGSLEQVPKAGCRPRSDSGVGTDFMVGGLKGQVTQDISASWFGGYLFDAKACGLGGGQDERLSVYLPEVTVLAYFLSAHNKYPMLRQPAWFLGTRWFFKDLDGTARFDRPLRPVDLPMDTDLVEVKVKDKKFMISSSRPVTIFMSESQGYLGGDNSPNLPKARRNRFSKQRDVGHGKWAFEKQVRAWYRSVALTSYHKDIRPAMKKLVKSIGSGPWLAGLWWGDSQAGFLASWLGQAIAAPTWGQSFTLDYYIYSSFTENPGNQCFVHAKSACKKCIKKCRSPEPPGSAYWMPGRAKIHGKPCISNDGDCGGVGIEKVVEEYKSKTAKELWHDIESKVNNDVSKTIFEVLVR